MIPESCTYHSDQLEHLEGDQNDQNIRVSGSMISCWGRIQNQKKGSWEEAGDFPMHPMKLEQSPSFLPGLGCLPHPWPGLSSLQMPS